MRVISSARGFTERTPLAQNSGTMKPAAEFTLVDSAEGMLEFEQPLTERMRTFLRVEFLHRQALYHAAHAHEEFSARAAVASLLEILTILGRADVRADVGKELDRHVALLSRYRRQPGVDPVRLDRLLGEVERLKAQLAKAGPQLMNPFKESDFLKNIRHRSAIPGGTCAFDVPDYGFWLRLPAAERARQFESWTAQLQPLCDAVAEVLWLTREANESVEQTATSGFYQQSLGRTEHLNLVRVGVAANAGWFPEVSAGPHRFSVRFLRWNGVDLRPSQVPDDVRFMLALC
jgi:cell division protein ZapD